MIPIKVESMMLCDFIAKYLKNIFFQVVESDELEDAIQTNLQIMQCKHVLWKII